MSNCNDYRSSTESYVPLDPNLPILKRKEKKKKRVIDNWKWWGGGGGYKWLKKIGNFIDFKEW